MEKLRTYGKAPFKVAVIHGGPGAPGEMAPVARELSSVRGVLEPLQTAKTIEGQLDELKEVLKTRGNPPLILMGWSWGAWLSFLFTAHHPKFVKKLILIGSGPFEEKFAADIMNIRLNRLCEEEKEEVLLLIKTLENPAILDKNAVMARFGQLISKADSYDYDPVSYQSEILECRYDIYQNIWEQAKKIRSSKKLLEFGKEIQCPVLAIHGYYDPHPYQGVQQPLSLILKDLRFILLEKCGHKPWIERSARDIFYKILLGELD
jgi:pimeloyl-ACP methyl ester carboxylesterase